jgi:RES domain-containing protein
MTPLIVWRMLPARHQNDAFSGDGARIAGGRWNLRGTRAVYLFSSLALAASEVLFFTGDAAREIPYVIFRVEVPDDVHITTLAKKELSSTWRVEPPPESLKRIGSAWIAAGSGVLLRVPSVLIPSEMNYLANPAHADFQRLRISKPDPFSFNPRIWKP